jgi:hypothetical protein
MANHFNDIENDFGEQLPGDLEQHLLHQINNFNVFGKVVELFVPNALETAAKLIGGGDPATHSGLRGMDPGSMTWRNKPMG